MRALFLSSVVLGLAACAPDAARRNLVLDGAKPLLDKGKLEVLGELPAPPGNITVSSDGRVFFSFHPEAGSASAVRVAELVAGKAQPFPDEAWQQSRREGPWFHSPLSLRADSKGWLWVLDHANYGAGKPAISAFDIKTRELVHRHVFPQSIVPQGSLLNDFAIDEARGFIYIADTGAFNFDPALIIYEIATKSARRVLVDHFSVKEMNQTMIVEGQSQSLFGLPLRVANDSIALSADGEFLYYGPMTGDSLYRLPTSLLSNPRRDSAALAGSVRRHCAKPASDGIAVDGRGRIYFTAIERDGIGVRLEDGRLEMLVQDPKLLSWPDGLSVHGGFLYITVSRLHHCFAERASVVSRAPFHILRVPLDR